MGDPTSMCDLKRTLSKIHTTVSLVRDDREHRLERWKEKMYSLSLTDYHTPIVRELVMLTRATVGLGPSRDPDGNWWSQFERDVQWPNGPADDDMPPAWMQSYVMVVLPGFDFDIFDDWYNDVRSGHADLLTMPLCLEPTHSPDVDGLYEVGSMTSDAVLDAKFVPRNRPAGYPAKEWAMLNGAQQKLVCELATEHPDLDWAWLGTLGRARIHMDAPRGN